MVSRNLKGWDTKLSYAEFACNRALSYANSHSPFEVCYSLKPLTPIDLVLISQESKVSFEVETTAKEMQRLHE